MKFISFVLVDALVNEDLLMRDPEDRNRILVKTYDSPKDEWASVNIFTMAEDLFHSQAQRDSLFSAIKEKTGKSPVFSSEGDFVGLERTGEYFLYGEGGPMSRYAQSVGQRRRKMG